MRQGIVRCIFNVTVIIIPHCDGFMNISCEFAEFKRLLSVRKANMRRLAGAA